MRAVVVTRFGGPEVLQIEDVPDPSPSSGEILVHVETAGVNYMDVYGRLGRPPYNRDVPFVLGAEGAGTVLQIAPGVSGFATGESRRVDRGARQLHGARRREGEPRVRHPRRRLLRPSRGGDAPRIDRALLDGQHLRREGERRRRRARRGGRSRSSRRAVRKTPRRVRRRNDLDSGKSCHRHARPEPTSSFPTTTSPARSPG